MESQGIQYLNTKKNFSTNDTYMTINSEGEMLTTLKKSSSFIGLKKLTIRVTKSLKMKETRG